MRESVIYQEILQEGRVEGELIGEQRGEQRGIIQGKQEIAINLLQSGMAVDQVVKFTGLPRELVESLVRDLEN